MTSPIGTIRPLRFPLYWQEDEISETPNVPEISHLSLDGWPTEDPDERIDIVLNLSLNEYIALATSIDVGRDIAYGDNGIYVWWVWVRGLLSLDICGSVLDCIEDTESIQEAIARYSLGAGANSETPENDETLATELINNPPDCDKDIIYGAITQMVTFIDEVNKDFFELISASANAMARLGDAIEAIPLVGELPLDDAFQLVEKINDDIYGYYLAASTVSLRNQVACDLMCIAYDNDCVLTFEDARDYFFTQGGEPYDFTDFLQVVEDLIANNLVGTVSFYAMYMMFFQILIFGDSILGNNVTRFVGMLQAMFNDPNSDWDTECDECPTNWSWDSDFENSKNIFEPQDDSEGQNATWSMGTGWGTVDKEVDSGAYFRQQNIDTDADFTPTTITKVVLTYDLQKGSYFNDTTGVVAIKVVRDGGGTEIEYLTASETSDGDGQTLEYTGSLTDVVEINVWVRGSISLTESYSGSCKIVSLHIEGDDFNPFV